MDNGKNYNSKEIVALRRELRKRFSANNDPTGWFEEFYAAVEGQAKLIPWARRNADRVLQKWLDNTDIQAESKRALVVGCGLGDDAEEISRRCFDVTAFDISTTAIAWCRKRFPNSKVNYVVHDLFKSKEEWQGIWDFVYEGNTLQSLPDEIRKAAIQAVSQFPAKGGTLLVNCFGRMEAEPPGERTPWPLSLSELSYFEESGLKLVKKEQLSVKSRDGKRKTRFRMEYKRA